MSRFDGVADAYRVSFATLCAGTVDRLLDDATGARLLDVGSGTGHLAAAARELGRSVVAVDADPDMVALTEAAVPGRALLAALPDLPFGDDAFDAVTANFVVNHVPGPRAAVRELARVTRPGGRLALTIWPGAPGAWGSLVSGAFAAAGVVPPAAERLPAHLDFERSADGLRRLVEEAGPSALLVEDLTWTWEVALDDLWRGVAGGVAGVGRTYLAQSPDVRDAAEREVRRAAAALPVEQYAEGVLRLPATAGYVLAER